MKSRVLFGLVGSAGLLASAMFASTGVANAGLCLTFNGTTQCTIDKPNGVQSIFISLDTPEGVLPVVNQIYDCETPVQISYQAVGPVHHWEIEECPPPLGVGHNPDHPLKANPPHSGGVVNPGILKQKH